MILFITVGIVFQIKEERFFNGIGKEVVITKDGVYSGYKIKKTKDVKGRKVLGFIGDWFVVDGKLYYKDKIIFEKYEFLNITRYKNYILCISIPSNIIYIFSDGKLKDSIETNIDNISGIQVVDDNIFLFTGGDGKVLKMDLKGEIKEFINLPVSNVVGIYKEKNRMYFYTYNPGRVYEYENGKLRVYYDPNITEINGLWFFQDTVYISGNNEIGGNIEGYVILIYGGIEKIVYRGTPIISSCLTDIGFICGENEDGQIGVFTKDGFKIIADFDEKEILSIIKDEKRIIVLTGENAGIYEIEPIFSINGIYETEVIDGGYGVIWGKIRYNGSGNFKIYYRTGKTNRVDSTWKDWEEYKGNIFSDDRYLKLKFNFISGKESLSEISINFGKRNRAPEIIEFTVLPQGVGFGSAQNYFGGQTIQMKDLKKLRDKGFNILDGSYYVEKNARCIFWDIKDEDNEPLYVKLFLMDMKKWKLIQENVQGNAFFINTSDLPEGEYTLKLTVYDSEDSVYKTCFFLNDMSSPEIKSYEIKNDKFQGIAYDKYSEIWEVTYKFEGEEFFRKAKTEDGVFDEKEERFYFYIDKSKENVTIKIEDRLGNIRIVPIKIK